MSKEGLTIVKNINLGSFNVDKSQLIFFEEGLFGFEHIKEYYLIDANLAPFMLLQSIEDETLGFIVCDPFIFFPDYEFDLVDEAKDKLKLEKSSDLLVLVIVTLSDKIDDVSANLVGPIVINIKNHMALQYIVNNPNYNTKHYLFSK
ncbi:MAG: flagellar assembly protein FliW [Exilispira sp.]